MKIADILRVLANNLDHPEGGSPDPRIQNPAGLINAEIQVAVSDDDSADTTASGNEKSPDDLFLPPLQQKQELLKKAVGVENVYDDGTPEEAEQAEEAQGDLTQNPDIIDRIKRLSGIPVAAIQELSNDEPLDD
jgi:hypothetical protein